MFPKPILEQAAVHQISIPSHAYMESVSMSGNRVHVTYTWDTDRPGYTRSLTVSMDMQDYKNL